jgi:arylsulfatase A-like enzyme
MNTTPSGLARMSLASLAALLLIPIGAVAPAHAAPTKKPNIIVIFADDVGPWNVSAYHRGMMGGRTPNIDRIASEGALFTDYYAQQSCTAGRAAFITGQSPFRTGLLRAGFPGARQGIQDKDPTIAELLKPLGYVSSQIGKNHLGDRNEYLPTVHGFDEFFGYLYHLNAMEEPEDPDFPKQSQFRAKFGARNVLDSVASDKDDATEDPRFGKVGKQVIKDAGPLTRKRMQTVEDEFTTRSLAFIEKSAKADKPFFLWHSSTRLHSKTHLSPKWDGKTGYGLAADGMAELDNAVGEILKKLDELKIADNTVIVFTSDNGPQVMSWPDGGNSPFKGEKGTTWEGGFRVPCVVRWPGVIKPGTIINDVMAHEDWFPTFLAAAGDPDAKTKLLTGMQAGEKTYKAHLDSYNFLPFFKGEEAKGPRREFFYFDDSANLNALRYDDWKITFAYNEGNMVNGHLVTPNMPWVVNLRQDPFERYRDESMTYMLWMQDKLWAFVPAQVVVGQLLQSFQQFPPSQKSGSFGIGQALEAIQVGSQGGGR